jgi:hypothetical protein
MLTMYPSYLNFSVADENANLYCSALPFKGPINVADRAYFKMATQMHDFAIGDYQIGRITQRPALNYGYPLLDRSGELNGVGHGVQSLDWLSAALAKWPFPRAVLLVSDRNGTVLARMPGRRRLDRQGTPEAKVLEALSSRDMAGCSRRATRKGIDRLWAHAPLIAGQDLHATMGTPKSYAFADINRRLARNLAGLALVTIVAVIAATLGGHYILRRVDALVAERGSSPRRARDARARMGMQERARSPAPFVQLDGRDAAGARTRAPCRRGKDPQGEVELAVTRAHMDIAKQIQRSLLPEDPLACGCVQYAGRCIPAGAVGGDYFGYFPRGRRRRRQPDRRCFRARRRRRTDHGRGAHDVHGGAPGGAERCGAAQEAQRSLHDDLECAGLFITACCAIFDAPTRTLSYANADIRPRSCCASPRRSARASTPTGCCSGSRRT